MQALVGATERERRAEPQIHHSPVIFLQKVRLDPWGLKLIGVPVCLLETNPDEYCDCRTFYGHIAFHCAG